jgi:hypothetical protein
MYAFILDHMDLEISYADIHLDGILATRPDQTGTGGSRMDHGNAGWCVHVDVGDLAVLGGSSKFLQDKHKGHAMFELRNAATN